MKIRLPNHVQPTYANFAMIATKGDEVVINLCFAEGESESPDAVVVHKVIMNAENFSRLIQLGRESLRYHKTGNGAN